LAARAATALALALALALAAPAAAHRVSPAEVVAQIGGAEARERYGVREVAPDPRLPRLLVVRVDARWDALPPALRRETAEAWRALWRHAQPQGVLAVAGPDGRSRVGFDAAGRAQLHEAVGADAGAPPPADPAGAPRGDAKTAPTRRR